MTTVDNNQLIKFNVNVTINENDEAVFKYTENGHEVSGGGEVTVPNTHGVYTLDEETLKRGFYFVGAELSGPIVEDFSFKIIFFRYSLGDRIQIIYIKITCSSCLLK